MDLTNGQLAVLNVVLARLIFSFEKERVMQKIIVLSAIVLLTQAGMTDVLATAAPAPAAVFTVIVSQMRPTR